MDASTTIDPTGVIKSRGLKFPKNGMRNLFSAMDSAGLAHAPRPSAGRIIGFRAA